MTARLLKQYQTQLHKSKIEREGMKAEVAHKQKMLSQMDSNIKDLEEKIKSLEQPKEITVTEHALIRFFERALGFDMDDIKDKIVEDNLKQLVEQLGDSGKYPHSCGVQLVLKDKMIVTVI